MTTHTSRASWRSALWGCLFGSCLATLIWAPSQWLAWVINETTQGRLQWHNMRGTVWTGSAQWSLGEGHGHPSAQVLPGRVAWTLKPMWAGMQINIHAPCCTSQPVQVQATLTDWSSWRIHIQDHTSTWPTAMLSGLGAPWNTLRLSGKLNLKTHGLQLHWLQGRVQFKGNAQLEVENLSSRLSPINPMGSYRLLLVGSTQGAPSPTLVLSTQQGPLLLSGQGQWAGTRLRFQGEASAQEGHEASFQYLLNLLGRRQGARSLISLG